MQWGYAFPRIPFSCPEPIDALFFVTSTGRFFVEKAGILFFIPEDYVKFEA